VCESKCCTPDDRFKLSLIGQWFQEGGVPPLIMAVQSGSTEANTTCHLMWWVDLYFSQHWICLEPMLGTVVRITTSDALEYDSEMGVSIAQEHWVMANPDFFDRLKDLLWKFYELHHNPAIRPGAPIPKSEMPKRDHGRSLR